LIKNESDLQRWEALINVSFRLKSSCVGSLGWAGAWDSGSLGPLFSNNDRHLWIRTYYLARSFINDYLLRHYLLPTYLFPQLVRAWVRANFDLACVWSCETWLVRGGSATTQLRTPREMDAVYNQARGKVSNHHYCTICTAQAALSANLACAVFF
jgi:hypothetical protein